MGGVVRSTCVGMFAEIMKPIEYDRDVINLIEKLAQADLDDEEMMNVFKHIDPTGEKDILHKEAIILSVLNYDLFTSYINKISYFPVKELIPIVEYKIKRETGASNIEAIMSKDIPSFANLHWSRIFQMREEGAMIDLRKKIIKASDKIQSDPRVITKTDISQIVDPALRNDLWSLVSDVKPNLASSVLMGIVSNYPTIFPIL
jgi:hypothetical protein